MQNAATKLINGEIKNQQRIWWKVAGGSALLSFCASFYGHKYLPSHVNLLPINTPNLHNYEHEVINRQKRLKQWETAQRVHLFHSFALLMVPYLRPPFGNVSGCLFLTGITMYCGSLYFQAYSGYVPPIEKRGFGGLLLVSAWMVAAVSKIVF